MERNLIELTEAENAVNNLNLFDVENKLLKAVHPADPLYDDWLELKETIRVFQSKLIKAKRELCKH